MRRLIVPLSSMLLCGLLTCAGTGAPHRRAVIDRPIRFTELRKSLTLKYLRRHTDPQASGIDIVPRIIVIHWTAIGTLEDSFRYFDSETLQPDRRDIRHGGTVNVSVHYLVDRDGTIYRLMPDTWMGRHVIGMNHCAIGIENVGGLDRPLTGEQMESNAWLVTGLIRSYPTIGYLIGHHEYLRFRGSPLWRQLDRSYRAHKKIDPGNEFMTELRRRIAPPHEIRDAP
ncbi:MAG: N-acetylmuramoyl-L-alanine amidase [Spirochaetes bacterium]|nr:N-acetylmuramoyl-L-alanine amidase [Spirochaetota bacterium]